jgi:murein DD-endopeptidase MepM/ murein hydrolase activator NlpD
MKTSGWISLVGLVALLAASGCDDGGSELTVVGNGNGGDTTGLSLVLPTANEALFSDGGRAFYMHTNRTFEGRRSQPWQAGQYGYVRNPVRTDAGEIVYTRRHEGLDIRPKRRDADGLAADTVRAIDEGRVVYANTVANNSNYGKYAVVRHKWGGSPYFSLYAHLAEIAVPESTRVAQGEPLGRVGHTGHGLNTERAHVHLEIALLLNRRFQRWFEDYYPPDANKNGLFSGLNLAGLNPAALYQALRTNEVDSVETFIQNRKPFYRALLPGPAPPNLTRRYPWLLPENAPQEASSWTVTLTETHLPLRVTPSDSTVPRPVATWARSVPHRLTYRALGYLTRDDGRVMLTRRGLKYARLLAQRDGSQGLS